MNVHANVLELVGNTPLVRLDRMAKGLAGEVLVKMESMNPLGQRQGSHRPRDDRGRRSAGACSRATA